jgi:cold shock CspA family protein
MDGYIKSYSEKKGYGFFDAEQHGVVFFINPVSVNSAISDCKREMLYHLN